MDTSKDQTPMPTSPVNSFIAHVRATEMSREADGDLLSAYIQSRDETALTALVHRHAPMVWGVCRRILRKQHDAEDAFQAAFLVLVRKAATISDRAAVGNWLYGVAHQTAVRTRANAMKTNRREGQRQDASDRPAAENPHDSELREIVDTEVVALPDKYRTVVVLCDLEELPRSEVARRLGVPEGTVAGRLARAREMLAKRFARRGLALPGGVVTALAVGGSASATVPTAVVADTVNAAVAAASGTLVTSSATEQAVVAARETMRSMTLAKVKAAVLIASAVIGCGVTGLAAYRGFGRSEQLPPVPAADDPKHAVPEKPEAAGPIKKDPILPDEDDKPKRKKDEDKDGDEDDKPKRKKDEDEDDKPKRKKDEDDKSNNDEDNKSKKRD